MFLDWYQSIPLHINPIAFSFYSINIHWYSIMWITSFVVAYVLLRYRVLHEKTHYDVAMIQDILANTLVGAIVGGRIGYVLFYNLSFYIHHPLSIISPFDFETHVWSGIYGMSYHGGLIGVLIALWYGARKYKINFVQLIDFFAVVVPCGYIFGRIGNFLNGELFGRITTKSIGMFFENEIYLRHPSQLYECFFEGVVPFLVLWYFRGKKFKTGTISALYLIMYACARFFIEFLRQPDEQLGFVCYFFTMGQILSLCMMCTGIIWIWLIYKAKI